MFTIGTLIMIRVPVSVDSAVAACPAPMFATSRSASSRAPLRSELPLSVRASPGIVISEKDGGVYDECRSAVAEDGDSAE